MSLRVLALVALALVVAPPARAKGKDACKKGERRVEAQTPVYGGPGLGFEIVRVVDTAACFRVLTTTEDGTFVLVELDKDKAGWVASGTVDAALGGDASTTTEAAGTFLAVRDLVLREAPAFDAAVVGATVPEKTALTRKAVSADRQWYLVSVEEREGWVPKYQVAEALPEAGAAPAATGSDGWASARAGRRPAASTTNDAGDPTATPDAGDPAATPDTRDPAATPDPASAGDPTPDDTSGDTKKPAGELAPPAAATDAAADVDAPPASSGPPLGRTQDLAITVGYRYWLQSYTSDAQQDPYFKYQLDVPVGGTLALDYGYRGEVPIVFDVRGTLGFTGYESPHIDGNLYTVLGTQLSLWPRVAWRLHENALVDVDAGLTAGFDGVFNYGLQLEDVSTTLTGFYFGVGPSLVARSRLNGGDWGLLVLEAAIPVGGYTMMPDPGARYSDYAGTADPTVADPNLVYPNAAPTGVVCTGPDDPACDPATVDGGPLTDGAIPVHVMVGAEGRVRYMYPFTDLVRLELGGSFTVRQAIIAGPGKRNGSYAEAANVDVFLGLTAGLAFGF